MKKNVIALVLSVVMTLGSIGTVPLMASEPADRETVTVQTEAGSEEAVEDPVDDADGESNEPVEELTEETDEQSEETVPEETGEKQEEAEEEAAEPESEEPAEDGAEEGAEESEEPSSKENDESGEKSSEELNGDTDQAAENGTETETDGQPQKPVFRGTAPTTLPGEGVVGDTEGKSPEELFSEYVEQSFKGQLSSGRRKAKRSISSVLTGNDRTVYEYIAGQLPLIAAGERASTAFDITTEILGLEQTAWTAGELGVSTLLVVDEQGDFVLDDDGYGIITDDAYDAVSEKVSINYAKIIDVMLADHPYELYWYDKTKGCNIPYGFDVGVSYDQDIDDYVIYVSGAMLMRFTVAQEFAVGLYEVDTSIGQSVQASVANAKAIVSKYSGSSDEDKLRGYMEEICDLVSYNDAAADGGVSYGNPWQLVWVFDGDPETEVVCEGYAKAFKYLCDQSSFKNDISCILVTGLMTGGTGAGNHMWNIVNMEDGKNYLVDVTNCDEGTIGYPDELFLVGTEETNIDGSGKEGYYFSDVEITYSYDTGTEGLFSDDDLELCGYNYGTHTVHEWETDYTVDKEATCSEEGVESIHCSVCDAVKEGSERLIPKTAHSYGDWTTAKEPTCTEAGSREKVCTVCGDKMTEAIAATGHSYGDWTTAKEPTCTEAGSREKVCTACGDKVTEAIAATGHKWETDYTTDKEATCKEEGTESIHCSVCGAVKEGSERTIPKTAHSYGDWTTAKEPTCTEAGIREKVCSACGDKVTEAIAATGHKWETDYTTDKEATCSEEGVESIHCSVCDAVKEGSERAIPKTAHSYGDWTTAKEPTCTEAGSREKVCTVCEDKVTEAIAATGHSYGDWTTAKEPTCTEAGSREKVCTACGDKVTEAIAATGHKWETDYTVDKEATCKEEGTESIHCSVCDAVKEGSERAIPKTSHHYGDWTTTKEATCTEAGSREKVCTECGNKVTEEIPAAHQWKDTYTVDKEPTETEEGSESIHCAVCDAIQEGSERAIPKTTHHYGDWIVAKEATCTEDGIREKVCTDCGDKVTEAIAATGHKWETDYTVDKEATCKEEGTESIHCEVCDAVQEGSVRAIHKTAHKYGDWTVTKEATCTEAGSREKICTVCENKVTETIAAAGHKWKTEYTIDKQPTETEEGSESIHCAICDEIKEGSQKSITKINKAKQQITAKAAATLEVGKTTKVTVTGAKETPAYTYKSSNNAIATVSSNGTVTGKGVGTVTITVSFSETKNYQAGSTTVKITVKKVLKKPGNCHFAKWNNSKYTGCQIAWKKVDGADGYQTLLSWTDGSHASATIVKANVLYRNCTVHPQHVSQMKVRAFYMLNGQRMFGPWSNIEYITPSPAKLTTRNTSKGTSLKMNISWNIIYGCNGYNVFLTTNPNGTWYWNQSTATKADATGAVITQYRGAKLKKNTRYYVRIVTRRKRNGVFCTVPMPSASANIGSFIIK